MGSGPCILDRFGRLVVQSEFDLNRGVAGMDLVSAAIDRHGRRLQPEEVIFREGEPSGEMYVIREGTVRVLKRVDDEEICLAILGPGEFFGEMGLLPSPRSVTVVAESEVLLIAIDATTFGQMLSETPELARRILARLAERLRTVDERLVNTMTSEAPVRVIRILHGLASQGEPVDERIALPAGVDDGLVAGQAGVLPSVVASIRERLEDMGMLGRSSDGRWWVSSLRDLEDFAEYFERKRTVDSLGLDELAGLAGMELAEAEVLAERVIAKRLAVPERGIQAGGLKTPLQRYLELKLRFEFRPRPQSEQELPP